MTDNTIQLHRAQPTVSDHTVELLEDLLEKAKAGELVSVAITGEMTGGDVLTLIGGDVKPFTLTGALEALKLNLLLAADEEDEG